jgi:hypothetical protein
MKGLTHGADHVDVRSLDGTVSLKTFTAGVLSYRPGWMSALWHVRVCLLRLLGQGEREIPDRERFTEQTLPVEAGEHAGFFEIVASDGETYWVAEGRESHLTAVLAVSMEHLQNGMRRFHLITVVWYLNRAGWIYFNLIRPFHHLVVWCAMRKILSPERGVKK